MFGEPFQQPSVQRIDKGFLGADPAVEAGVPFQEHELEIDGGSGDRALERSSDGEVIVFAADYGS